MCNSRRRHKVRWRFYGVQYKVWLVVHAIDVSVSVYRGCAASVLVITFLTRNTFASFYFYFFFLVGANEKINYLLAFNSCVDSCFSCRIFSIMPRMAFSSTDAVCAGRMLNSRFFCRPNENRKKEEYTAFTLQNQHRRVNYQFPIQQVGEKTTKSHSDRVTINGLNWRRREQK